MEKHYYVDVPPALARSQWADFEHELSFPAAALDAHLGAVEGDPDRTHVILRTEGEQQTDEAMWRFRLFLASRGLIRLEPPL